MDDPGMDQEMARVRERLVALEAERAELASRLAGWERARTPANPSASPARNPAATLAPITAASPSAQKIALFRRLFSGRQDVFPIRWENARTNRSGYSPACANEWIKGICAKPQVKCGACPNQAFITVSDDVVARHLSGKGAFRSAQGSDYVLGVYPLLADETCWFLAADFDGADWAQDALAFLETCQAEEVPAALERSRSGEGGHVWIFFAAPVPARTARRLGAWLVTRTMERRPEVGFASYDRFFPSQDTMPVGGFGNLIALPLQASARARKNSVFVDRDLQPYQDQWAFLASIQPIDPAIVTTRMLETEVSGGLFGGVRLPLEEDNADEPWCLAPSRRREPLPISDPLPARVRVVLADQVYVDRSAMPASMTIRLIRLAAFQNPEFYRAQAMRQSTFGKPRIVSCAELTALHIGLPRGCLDEALALLRSHGIAPDLEDHRYAGSPLPSDLRFSGELRGVQSAANEALAAHDFGVLAATTAFGKTVVAASLIARRQCNTLVLVHRRELLTQWVERLKVFLSIDPACIGTIGGGRHKPTGIIDVALIQSLVRKGEVSDLVGSYGHLIVDECHHLSASSFELAVRRAKPRHVLGLSATVVRKDGHHPIIFMQCGPVRYRVDARTQAAQRGIDHRVRLRPTQFRLPPAPSGPEQVSMPAIYAALAQDAARNELIFDDVLSALEAKRSPVVLTERRDHLEYLRGRFERFARNIVVLHGGMTSSARNAAQAVLKAPDDQERLILATGRYLGEGFDDPRLDTLFLTMPISWRGTLAQYVGRLHREHHGKDEVLVYDYTDSAVPVLGRMAAKRQAGYRSLGYVIA